MGSVPEGVQKRVQHYQKYKPKDPSVYHEFTEFLVRADIDSVSINPDAAVFTRKLVASVEQRIMLEKALGQVKVDPDWDLPDPDE
ncbi:MAG: hypothetical protein ACPLZ8_07380 [Fervidicoccaceae archaeon]